MQRLLTELRSSSISICSTKKLYGRSYSYRDKEMIINYIKNQQEHHKKESFSDEIKRIFREEGIDLDEKWFWEDS